MNMSNGQSKASVKREDPVGNVLRLVPKAQARAAREEVVPETPANQRAAESEGDDDPGPSAA
jgi:hypothetical protein